MKHALEQPFVAATGLAALVHSTWALGTLFAGNQPKADLSIEFLGWLLPALLIAFALDIGQIATSNEIRQHGMTWARGATFAVFAVATYYLQWLYIAHHMPALDLAEGVRASWADTARLFRDSAIWLIPALLPASTLLYTFSGRHDTPQQVTAQPITITAPEIAPAPISEPLPWLDDSSPALEAVNVVPDEPPVPVLNEPLPYEEYSFLTQAISVTDVTPLIDNDPKEARPAVTPRRRKNNGLTESVKNNGRDEG